MQDERSQPAAGVREGDVIAGKYLVDKVLGVGGMGVVVAAHHVQLETKVAIKFLLPGSLTSPEAIGRFEREAKAAVKITSEHVARVFDVGTLETGAPYMVMEFLEGGDLAAWLLQRGALPIDLAVEFILQASVALAEAHGLGIVHRDLKPANLFCIRRPDGQLSIKVLDFGISKVLDGNSGAGMSVTRTSALMGSPLYMSPEQMESARNADAQSDIWALGVILYQLLAGKVPFDGETLPEVAIKVAMQPPPPLRALRPEVPPGLEAAVMRCLAKARTERFKNVAELAMALAEFAPARARGSIERISGTVRASRLSTGALQLPPVSQPSGVHGGTIDPVGQTTAVPAPTSLRRSILVGASTAGLLMGIAGVIFFRVVRAPPTPVVAPSDTTVAAQPGPQAPGPLPVIDSADAAEPGATTSHPAPPVTGAASPAHAPTTATTTPRRQTPSSNCDPPFTLDAQGHKHFKPECYLK
jgi:serine/threonine-protein kinase